MIIPQFINSFFSPRKIHQDVKSSRKGYKGKLFAAKKGEWMDAELKEKDNKLSITVSAGFMSKTVEWFKE